MMSNDHTTTRLRIQGLVQQLGEDEGVLRERAAERLGTSSGEIQDAVLIKRSLDARGRPNFVCHVEVEIEAARAIDPSSLPHGVSEAPRARVARAARVQPLAH